MTERSEQHVRIVEWDRRASKCRICGNEITWAVTLAGARMPLEPAERLTALMTRSQLRRVPVRYAYARDRVHRILVVDVKYEEKLIAQGRHIREELVELWEIPASLTHFANCAGYRK